MRISYARVSTQDQDLTLQLRAVKREGCERAYQEKASGGQRERQELLSSCGAEDTLVIWKLDRLARSLKQLIETVRISRNKASASNPCKTPSTPVLRAESLYFTSLPPWLNLSGASFASAPMPAWWSSALQAEETPKYKSYMEYLLNAL